MHVGLRSGIFFVTVILLLVVTCTEGLSSSKEYRFPHEGFSAAFPKKPSEFKTPLPHDGGFSNSYQALITDPVSQYSVFVSHLKSKVFEDASIQTYIEEGVRGLLSNATEAKLHHSRPVLFHGFPAREYQFSEGIGETRVVYRGIILIVDGDSFRLSYNCRPDDPNAEKDFHRFKRSFQLIPMELPVENNRFISRTHRVSIVPPRDWTSSTPKFPQSAGSFVNDAGHSINLISASGYSCASYRNEGESARLSKPCSSRRIDGKEAVCHFSAITEPSYGVRIISKHYCVNTRNGIAVIVGTAPEKTFFRSERIIEHAAMSLRIEN